MLTENQLEMLGNQIAALYQALEQDVIADIARRVKKAKRFTETAELMAQAMKETGKSPDQIRAEVMKLIRADKAFQDEVAKNTKEWKEFVREEIKATEAAAKEAGNDIIANAGDMSFNYDMEAWQQAGMELTKDSAFTRMVEEMSKATAGTLKNLTRSTGFKGVHGTTALKNAYRQYLDKALIKMATGTFSYDQCVNDCVKELAQSGLRSIDYTSGRTYQLDTAARMAIRTANSQLAGQISMHYIEETDTDLVEVSAHWGARTEHAEWQGKIYSRSGKNKKYPNFSACHYGEVDGLKGINCRHDFYPFFEGVSEPNTWPDEPKPQEYHGKTYNYYQATQKQRKMERDIRATKREIEAQKAIGGDTSVLEAQKRKQIKEYHNFSNAMGIRAKDNRLRVIKGTSDLKKTQTTQRVNVSRARREAAEKLFSVEPVEKGDVILAENIYKDLKRSEIGQEVIEFIEKNNIDVQILNNKSSVEDMGMENLYGYQRGKRIYINALQCKTKKKVVETLIHEKTHLDYPEECGRHVECVCDAQAMKHRKGKLTGDDLRSIIKSVNERYPDYKWRAVYHD